MNKTNEKKSNVCEACKQNVTELFKNPVFGNICISCKEYFDDNKDIEEYYTEVEESYRKYGKELGLE